MAKNKLELREVRIIWANFQGLRTEYNALGNRNFNILIEDEQLAQSIAEEGWNIKTRDGFEDGDPPFWTLAVKVNFDSAYPPRIYKINEDGTKKTLLDSKTVMILDLLKIKYADVLLSPFAWQSQGRSGISAYLDTMYVVVEENPLDLKWNEKADLAERTLNEIED